MANENIRPKIGVLTSGGDAPGMNAAARAVTKAAIEAGYDVLGIKEGYKGLIDGNMQLLDKSNVDLIINKGGTFLYSARCKEFMEVEGMEKAKKTCIDNNIVGVVAIGGDGTFRGATDLSNLGIRCIGVPGTIDNDITSTDYSIGFDTAMNTVIDMVDRLRDTCESHLRCNVVEVMGRAAGYIALEAGIAVGATAVICKEVPYSEEAIIKRLMDLRAAGKRNFLILLAEGVPLDQLKDKSYGEALTKRLEEATGIETRFARLAHVVRGGNPTLRDRLIASQLGEYAVRLLVAGETNKVVCIQDDQLTSLDINYALKLDKMFKEMLDPTYEKKLKPGDLDCYDEATVAGMKAFCEKKYAAFKAMYDVADKLGK